MSGKLRKTRCESLGKNICRKAEISVTINVGGDKKENENMMRVNYDLAKKILTPDLISVFVQHVCYKIINFCASSKCLYLQQP